MNARHELTNDLKRANLAGVDLRRLAGFILSTDDLHRFFGILNASIKEAPHGKTWSHEAAALAEMITIVREDRDNTIDFSRDDDIPVGDPLPCHRVRP